MSRCVPQNAAQQVSMETFISPTHNPTSETCAPRQLTPGSGGSQLFFGLAPGQRLGEPFRLGSEARPGIAGVVLELDAAGSALGLRESLQNPVSLRIA